MPRHLIYAANWKLHHGPAAARRYAEKFQELVGPRPGRELWFFPPAVSIAATANAFRGRGDVRIGAQNVSAEPKGAFTGELSIAMIEEVGATAALVGHSERRHVFGETDAETGRKVAALARAGLTPVLCVGEQLTEREAGRTDEVVLRQLAAGLDGLAAEELHRLVIAYEPVWAIGTGRNATPGDAAAVHRVIRRELEIRGARERIPILYGGSVNAGNALALLAEEELDGVLVGGASLDPEVWAAIVGFG
ncbi:MAG TPA: triose-phosphate isomerase [Gemmatimonadales bacterium]|nr:triose-phosphate isomerase [Gemmatimonadales bacterium]